LIINDYNKELATKHQQKMDKIKEEQQKIAATIIIEYFKC